MTRLYYNNTGLGLERIGDEEDRNIVRQISELMRSVKIGSGGAFSIGCTIDPGTPAGEFVVRVRFPRETVITYTEMHTVASMFPARIVDLSFGRASGDDDSACFKAVVRPHTTHRPSQSILLCSVLVDTPPTAKRLKPEEQT